MPLPLYSDRGRRRQSTRAAVNAGDGSLEITYDDAPPVPTMGGWGLATLLMVLAGTGVALLRRRGGLEGTR